MTNDELCRVMDIVLREIEMNVSFTLEQMEEMDLNGHTAEFWLARWDLHAFGACLTMLTATGLLRIS